MFLDVKMKVDGWWRGYMEEVISGAFTRAINQNGRGLLYTVITLVALNLCFNLTIVP